MTKPFVPDPDAAIIRYQVADVARAVAFYTEHLGFRLLHRAGPVATITRGALHVLLSGPESSGARAMPDGTRQGPGGWNRIVLYVDDLTSAMSSLERARVHFRNSVETGPGGKQVLVDDPDGNVVELHEAPRT
ncbi:MAG TPA: VOC family protein [Kofleriaceae bacterium]|nr:VOC family protein [Kofleriaceae bacterium]